MVWSSRYKRVSLFNIDHSRLFGPSIGSGSRFLTLAVNDSLYTVTLQDIISTRVVRNPDCYEPSLDHDPNHFCAALTLELRPTINGMEIYEREHEYYRGSVLQANRVVLSVNDGKSYQNISIQSVDELLAMLRGLSARKQYVQP